MQTPSHPPQCAVIHIEELRKAYPSPQGQVPVLKGISGTVLSGETVVLKGVSGSGKSTLLNVLGALDGFDSGNVEVCGADLGRLAVSKRATFRASNIGFVFQYFNLLPMLSVVENVGMSLAAQGVGRKERHARSMDMLRAVGLEGHAGKFPDQLSGGEQQRVSIARAMVKLPPLILADEPTGALDEATASQVLDLMHSLQAEHETTLFLATHDSLVSQYADVEWRLSMGHIEVSRP